MKKVRFVRVDWIDSVTNGGWSAAASVADGAEPTHIVSGGFLLEKNNRHVVIAQSLSESTQEVCNLLTIPRGNVVRIRRP